MCVLQKKKGCMSARKCFTEVDLETRILQIEEDYSGRNQIIYPQYLFSYKTALSTEEQHNDLNLESAKAQLPLVLIKFHICFTNVFGFWNTARPVLLCCLWLFSHYSSRLMDCNAKNTYYVVFFYRKGWPTLYPGFPLTQSSPVFSNSVVFSAPSCYSVQESLSYDS